jgi:hypothetical protein
MKRATSVVLSLVFMLSCSSFGKDAPKANPFTETLSAAPAAELPAKAADLILQTKTRSRPNATINVVRSAVGLNPAAAPAIVGAIAKAVPDMAALAAGTAAAEQPKQASAIAKAAAAAAPSKAGPIVLAVCRAVPNDYRDIAVAVSQAVPGASKEIVNAVGTAMPDLKPAIAKALAGYGGNVPTVPDTLSQAAIISQSQPTAANGLTASDQTGAAKTPPATPMFRGPAVGPPYVPLTGTATNVTTGTSGEVPPGGRNYAKP